MKKYVVLFLLSFASLVSHAQSDALNSKTQFAELSGRKLAYRSIGKGSPVILVNRFRGTLDTWDPLFLDQLAAHHRVITFDYSGIGYSTGELPADITKVAADVSDLAKYLKLDQVIVIGWSYGGLVSQVAALQNPNLVTHTILLGTGPVGKREVPLDQAFLDPALKPVNDLNDEIVLFFEPASVTSREAAKASHDRIARRLDVSRIPSTMNVFERYFKGGTMAAEDAAGFRGQLMTTKMPILVISGDHDISFAVENWFPLVRKLPTTQLIVLPLTGHAPQHQHPALVVSYIEGFLAR
ncbi:alpha/beta hydrolase [Terrimonas sp. NA20]|uniref:Alpha/beta hydrolase n=1 Tax=Terrimonas ginsenosidimutans TaxID=2908004 RepID=A0ABS9KS01_9BACT|nr:alpha/beta hydrolase [Terrimonas ginsenosidimutans]MCG2615089.1 alpha/beta hydrolase [Terrimonas ginsenosidimutans]